MTTRPRLKRSGSKLPGLAAVALFAVLAAVFVTSQFGDPVGFGEGSITASIGYAMFNLGELATHESEGFLVAFILIAVVLDAALDGSVMLAKRDSDSPFSRLSERVRADGGREDTTDTDYDRERRDADRTGGEE
jgi:NADH-quinone oxidoreductase subunit J